GAATFRQRWCNEAPGEVRTPCGDPVEPDPFSLTGRPGRGPIEGRAGEPIRSSSSGRRRFRRPHVSQAPAERGGFRYGGYLMNEEAPFLRALWEEPADETTRLAYADWLEERGDPRGEYLRLWCRVLQDVRRLRDLRPGIAPGWLEQVHRDRFF